jgi:orotate phosphoribosyltransferase
MGVGYSTTFFRSWTLKEAAKVYIRRLPKDVDGLLTQGTSGCAIASAIMALSNRDLRHISVRKDKEEAHSAGFAGVYNSGKYVIVDDFMSTGQTVSRLWNWAKARNLEVVAVIVGHEGYSSIVRDEIKCPVYELDDLINYD